MNQEQVIVILCLAGIIIALATTRIRPVFLFSGAISLFYLLDLFFLHISLDGRLESNLNYWVNTLDWKKDH